MWGQYLVGLAALALLATFWVGVQTAWRRAFPTAFADPDVLAGRMGCHGCSCTGVCERKRGRTRSEEES